MEKEKIQNQKLGAFGREIRDDVLQIIELSQIDVEQYVQVDYEIPKHFSKTKKYSETDAKRKEKAASDVMKSGLPETLGAVLATGIGIAVFSSAPAVIICAGVGTMTGSVAGKLMQNLEKEEPAEVRSLQKKDIKLIRIPNEAVLEERKKELLERAEKINRKLAEHEQNVRNVHDIALDRGFGEWVQKFLVYAEKQEDNRRLQQLKDGLLDRLASMNLHVYDEVSLDENGKPDVPIQDYLIDSRMGEAYTKVVKPAIYSDRDILARGEIE